jgi:RNA 3'-terminal phosphate cyclase-like protein
MATQHLPPLRFTGCANFRQRIALSTLSGRRIVIASIRSKDDSPGLRDYEANFLRLMDKLTNGSSIEINETGTSLRYSPGFLLGGSLEHDCGTARSIGWFLEGILALAAFGKKPLALVLKGVTNDDVDYCVDTLKFLHLPAMAHFGVKEGLELELVRRGCTPGGGGEVRFACPAVRELKAINFVEEGYIKKIRGVAYACKVSPLVANRMVDSAR